MNKFNLGDRVIMVGNSINYSSIKIGSTGTVIETDHPSRQDYVNVKWDKPVIKLHVRDFDLELTKEHFLKQFEASL